MVGSKLGELLVREGLLKAAQLEKVLEEQRKTGQKFGVLMVQLGFVREEQVAAALSKHYQLPSIDLGKFDIDPAVIKMVPRDVCDKNCIIPVMKQGNGLVVAFSDPANIFLRDDLTFITRCKITVVVAPESSVMAAVNKYYGDKMSTLNLTQTMSAEGEAEFKLSGASGDVEMVVSEAISGVGNDDAPIVRFVNAVLGEAIRRRASDIHFEPYEKKFRVRYRVDGSLIEASDPPQGTALAIVSRIKIMSRLDIAEKRKPQDGRLRVKTSKGKDIDFRVSTVPTMWGEKIVLRILDKGSLQLDMTRLGFEPDDLAVFKDCIYQPQGLVLITGPTGSGKTTTIYSALADLNKPDVNISTAEDPIEFNFEGINQVQMNPDIDLNFASALKAFLRQDPDIIMVGEIRDLETAEIAFKAASTGHLVVSTLHTNDAPGTVSRLTDMGIPTYLITSTISLILAQRLVGKICESCKVPHVMNPKALFDLGLTEEEAKDYKIMRGKGCNFCNGTGVRGRLAIYELMRMTEGIREQIIAGGSTADLRKMARTEGLKTLRRAGLLKLKRGETTIEEVLNSSLKDV